MVARNVKFIIVEEDSAELDSPTEMALNSGTIPFTDSSFEATDAGSAVAEASRGKITNSYASPSSITAAGGITVAGKHKEVLFITSDSGVVDITANPQIGAGTSVGDRLTLVGTSDTNYVLLENGNGLRINGTKAIKDRVLVELLWDGTVWLGVNL